MKPALRYGFGVATIVVAALVQKAVWPFIPPSPQLLFYPSVLIVARVAGFGPALFSVALSVPILARWFLPPYAVFAVDRPDDILDLVIFVVMAILLSALIDRLQRAERKARVAIEAAPVPTLLLAKGGQIVYANPAALAALRVSSLAGTALEDRIHPEDKDGFRTAFAELSEETAFSCRFTRDRVVYAEGTISRIRHSARERYLAQFVDVTTRKTAEAERERLLAQLRTIIEECPVGLLVVREGGRILESNAVGQALYGRSPPATLAESQRGDLLDSEGRPLALEDLPSSRALRGERISGLEIQMRRADGLFIPLLVNAAPIAGTDGEASAVVAFQDLSAIKELERLRVQWNAVVAHDLRQPINSILLRSQLLALKSKGGDAERKEIDAIASTTRRLNGMVQDLLDASRIEVREMPLARRDVDLGAFLADRLEEAHGAAPERAFEITASSRDVHVHADPDRLAQIVDNLLSNAVKYASLSSPIRTEIGTHEGMASVAVTNHGEGIAKGEIPHVFERFRRTDAAIRKKIRGIGLGLYIVRELVIAHGGEITCTSEPGAATTFRFTIPLEGAAGVRRARSGT
jgi:PAS domain S-box-containing protein